MRTTHFFIVTSTALALFTGSYAVAGDAASTANVAGTVRLEGTAPKPVRIDMSADPKCGKLAATTEEVVRDSKGGLENVVVFISDGLGDRTFGPPQQPVVIEQKGCMYKPHVVAMRANQKLDVVNSDNTTHNIHPIPNNNREWNKSQPPGLPIEETFARQEIAIPVKCNVHPWMRGYIAVFKHPYFAVTDKNGSFDLKNLPPGNYTIQAWHEKLGTVTQKVTVGAGENKTVEFILKTQPGY